MTRVGRKPRRYILVTSNMEMTRETRAWLTDLVLREYPALGKNELVWYPRALIMRTTLQLYERLRSLFSELRHDEFVFTTALSSGTIINLKRRVKETGG